MAYGSKAQAYAAAALVLSIAASVSGADAAMVDASGALGAGSRVAIVRPDGTGLPDLNIVHSTGIVLGERGTLGFIGSRVVTINLRNGQLAIESGDGMSANAGEQVTTTTVSASGGGGDFGPNLGGGGVHAASGFTTPFGGSGTPTGPNNFSAPSFGGGGGGGAPFTPFYGAPPPTTTASNVSPPGAIILPPPGAPGSSFVPPAPPAPTFRAPSPPAVSPPPAPPSTPPPATNAPAPSTRLDIRSGQWAYGSALTLFDIHNEGTLYGGSGTAYTYLTGFVDGAGSYKGNVAFTGTFSPGNSPANIIGENMLFNGTLVIQLGGTSRKDPAEYDSFDLSGTATLGGTLDVQLIAFPEGSDVFVPHVGDTFDILRAALIVGSFANILFPQIDGAHFEWQVLLLDDGLYDFRLTVVSDQTIQALDVVTEAPEPTTFAIIGTGLVLVGAFRRRQRRRA